MAHNTEGSLEVEFLGKFESIFGTALNLESGDQLGTFGEITFRQKNLTLLSLQSQKGKITEGLYKIGGLYNRLELNSASSFNFI